MDGPLVMAPGAGVEEGTEVDVPVPPTMPASLPVVAPDEPVAFCAGMELEGTVAVWATAMFAQATSAEPNKILCSLVMVYSWESLKPMAACAIPSKAICPVGAALIDRVTKAGLRKFRSCRGEVLCRTGLRICPMEEKFTSLAAALAPAGAPACAAR